MTVIELLVACGLLAIILVTVMTLFGQLLRNAEKNAMLAAATHFAELVLTEQIAVAENTLHATPGNNAPPAFSLTPVEGEGYLSTADQEARTKFLYRLEAERIDPGVIADPGQLWFVKVEVRWWSDDTATPDPSRSGFGNLSVKRSRLVYLAGPS